MVAALGPLVPSVAPSSPSSLGETLMRYHTFLLASLSLGLAACASSSGSSSQAATSSPVPGAAPATVTTSGLPNTLLAAEIQKANVPTAYEAVDRLRRKWWKDVTAPSGTNVAVYMDNK